jgi:hypothetical protein
VTYLLAPACDHDGCGSPDCDSLVTVRASGSRGVNGWSRPRSGRVAALFCVLCAVMVMVPSLDAAVRGQVGRIAGAGWPTPVRVGPLANPTYEVGIGANGGSLVFWQHGRAFELRAVSASGHLGPTQTVWPRSMGETGVVNGSTALLVVAPDLSAAMLWTANSGSSYVRTRSPSGALGPLRRLANLGHAIPTGIVVAPGGRATVLMSAFTHHEGENLVYLQQLEPNGRLDQPVRVAFTGGQTFAESASIALDQAGTAILTWTTIGLNDTVCCARVWTRTLSAGGKVGPTVAVSPPGDDADNGFTGASPSVTVAPNGLRTFVWTSVQLPLTNAPVGYVQARTMTAHGVLGPVRTISPSIPLQNPFDGPRSGNASDAISVQLAAVASGRGTAIASWIIDSDRGAVFYERSVTPARIGAIGRIVSGAYMANTGQVVAGAHGGLAVWQSVRNLTTNLKTGIEFRSVSSTGKLGAVQTALKLHPAADSVSVSVAAAMNASGRAVAVTNSRTGLVILAHRGS